MGTIQSFPKKNQTTRMLLHRRLFSARAGADAGWLLGAFEASTKSATEKICLTGTAARFDADAQGRLMEACKNAGVDGKSDTIRMLYGLGGPFPSRVAVVGLGQKPTESDSPWRDVSALQRARHAVRSVVLC
jgi:hypothetical protein